MSNAALYSTVKGLQAREFDPKETLMTLKAELYVYFSWGVSRLVNFDHKALGLLVNGKHYKFWVIITLESSDLYTVTFLKRDYSIRAQVSDLYFDQLAETIDWAIESKKDFLKEIVK